MEDRRKCWAYPAETRADTRRCQRLVCVILLCAGLLARMSPHVAAASDGGPLLTASTESAMPVGQPVQLKASTPAHVVLELSVPVLSVSRQQFGGKEYAVVVAPGLDASSLPGRPSLPQIGVLVGLPPTGGWSVHVLHTESQILPVAEALVPVPGLAFPTPGPRTAVAPSALSALRDDTVFAADAPYPASPVDAADGGLVRDLRVLRLRLYPVRYNPARGELEHIRRMQVEVRFDQPVDGAPPPQDAWDSILGRTVINYSVARNWRGVQSPGSPATLNPPATTPGSFKIEVDRDGLYLLTYEDLQRAGFPVSTTSPKNLHLTTQGREVAMQVEVGPDAKFTPGDWLLFYGEAARGRYTRLNVYWLFSDATAGVRMTSRSVAPQGIYPVPSSRWLTSHVEQNKIYDGLYPEPDGDHWYWARLQCPSGIWGDNGAGNFDLALLAAEPHTATLRISLQGHTFNTHDLFVKVNGHDVGHIVWDGPVRWTSEQAVPASWLRTAGNLLRLETSNCPTPPAAPNEVVLNYFEVEHVAGFRATRDEQGNPLSDFWGQPGNWQYELDGFETANVGLLDLTDPARPSMLTGADWEGGRLIFQDQPTASRRYLATAQAATRTPRVVQDSPSDLTAPATEADYLLIGYAPFLPATQPLVDLRVAQGLRVLSVDVQDVYDEFSYGLLDPGAVRTFLAHAAAGWQAPPVYVLLVGDGTIDFHDYRGNGWHNYLPAYPADVELHAGPNPAETASDNELDPGIGLPFYLMGRLPVTSVEQTLALVAKIVQYEVAPPPPFWNRRLLFVADKADASGQSFAAHSDEVYGTVAEPLVGDRIYLVGGEPTQPHEYPADTARAAIRDRFVDGQLLVMYMGHSSPSQWSADTLLHRNDVPELQSGGKLPIVLSMTCYTGAFQWPDYAPLDERLVVEPGGGAVAAWGATGSAVATGHRHLAAGFFDALQQEGPVIVGAATYAGLARLYANAESPAMLDLIDTYVLLGDPAMALNRFTGSVWNNFMPLAVSGR